jgi:alkylation response protein AidB-like acyl-CoA dehydrogenase
MDFALTDEQELVRETARRFTDNEIMPAAKENARNKHFDVELVRKLADQGYLGAIVPREYGGAGLDYVTYGLIVEEIGRGDSAMRTVVSVQTSLVCSAILSGAPRSRSSTTCPSCAAASGSGASG